MSKSYYLPDCPLGHQASLQPTNFAVAEGFLRACNICGQLVSSCTQEVYDSTMQEFDTPEGTAPSGKAIQRSFKVASSQLGLIQHYLKKPAPMIKLLDLGCSSGAFLEVARELGFQAEGLEPAHQAAITAQQKGFTVHIGTIESVHLPENSFDAITLFEVIEHIKDPVMLLNACQRILKPGGVIMIGTGNTDSWTVKIMKARWEYFDMGKHGGHISFFNKSSIKMLATQCKLKPVYVKTRAFKFFEKEGKTTGWQKIGKLVPEILNWPTRWFNVGHDMLTILQK
jgi:2-polyprenyl-3-methyl-5-hydroxy-6-metoxy-1,4-benzoquinol methylase